MEFRIADTFTDSLGRLTGEEQKAVKTAAFDLQLNPALLTTGTGGLQMHRLDKAKDPNFWSVRVSRDVRLIVHRTGASLLLCYVSHHDQAYDWAERRRLETHPKTGAAQLVEIRERVHEIAVARYVDAPATSKALPLLAKASDDQLLGYGVPQEWIADLRAATEDSVLEIAAHLPAEAREAVLSLATGVVPAPAPILPSLGLLGGRLELSGAVLGALVGADAFSNAPTGIAFEHPDAQRRFRTVKNLEELELALDAPWEKWAVFLHPAQRQLVARDFNGPYRVAGSAGTGKTIVALHRAVHLAEAHPTSRVLLTTFSEVLANALSAKLRILIGSKPRLGEQIEVLSMHEVGLRLYESNLAPTRGKARLATPEIVRRKIEDASASVAGHKFPLRFLMSEGEQVVDAWQLKSWEEYRDVARLGRRTRLREPQRQVLWSIFSKVLEALRAEGLMTESELFTILAKHYAEGAAPPFDFTVVDEAQDISVAQLRSLAVMSAGRPNALFFAGDTGQRIFQQPFSWKSLGVDVRGRSSTLKVNYRRSHQIRTQADRLLDSEVRDVDGNTEDRRGTVSVFDGPMPQVTEAGSAQEEQAVVAGWLMERAGEGLRPDEMVVFVRSASELPRAEAAAAQAGLSFKALDSRMETTLNTIPICTMHLAKGLEFRAVVVMACDEDVLPLQERVESASDPSDLEDIYNTERQLLYVACTRARDCLLITSAGAPSEFLRDFADPGQPSRLASQVR